MIGAGTASSPLPAGRWEEEAGTKPSPPRRPAQPREIEAGGELAEKMVFGPFHLATLVRAAVIEAAQVEDAVDDIADQFGLPGGAEAAGLRGGLIHADDDLTVQTRGGNGGAMR